MIREQQQQQLNLFPLHPENLFEERDVQDDNVAYFFDADGGVSLNGLLGVGGGVLSPSEEEEEEGEQDSFTYTTTFGGQESDEVGSSLARTALRQRERVADQEKWVVYSDVVENKDINMIYNNNEAMSTDTCNSSFSFSSSWQQRNHPHQTLLLKLDYEEILNAWSDKAPLYIEGECPQTVPDVLDDSLSNGLVEGGGLGGNAEPWRVPDVGNCMEGTKKGQRQARVLRYKQKRQSRLFSKRIRYEVRKLNAEKRPRMKGRFVKRN
ncbi:hypothetical protein NE237_006338 [Protea cynaroides]|uniref:CCT domain-containing protein n=1 Tax=Protea cynaroides TaxID=273540 RepID=A0A9Q0KMZ1_9MAGN|nr:hypothetical protein NE237_006338 [Protea cynaroides]